MVDFNLKPSTQVKYPPFKNGLYMEEYFSRYWANESFQLKDRFVYLDIFWQNLFHSGDIKTFMSQITPYVVNVCKEAANENKIVFTLCQWDDGIQLQCDKPDNLIIFSIGGSNNYNKDNDIRLPLIVEDVNYKLSDISKVNLSDKTILCSFIGTCTHDVRHKMVAALQSNTQFEFHIKNSWTLDIPENMMTLFIDKTLKSKFALGPRGYGNSSFRFFEIMQLHVIPIYVYDIDNVNGLPYQDILDYSRFSIIIRIDQIHTLPDILHSITDDQYNTMLKELEIVRLWFTPHGTCEYVRKYLINTL